MKNGLIVIFDLDGTLIDTIGDLAAAVENALSRNGFPGHSVEEYRKMVGHGIRNLVTRALPEGVSEGTIDTVLSNFVEYYTAHIDVLSRPYPGIHQLLRGLNKAGVKLAVTSNKFQAGTEMLIRRFFPDIPFVKILGNAPGLPLKPDAAVVRLAMDAAETSRGVLVGDSATDIRTAHNACIPAIAVSWGFRPKTDLEAAEAIADSVEELSNLIFEYLSGNSGLNSFDRQG
ncbi:MAG: HAD hydrolase-like protein [Bacteroidales bacterium]|nr:HAD hydrolase-like protein [Bacteroidales bacterium]